MNSFVDFRSDASTTPTPGMRQAMAEAPVGNDDFGEDPTVVRLEQTVARLLDKEDAVFVHSGTMANLAAVMSHTEPGETVLIGKHFHIHDYEGAAMERVAQCRFRLLDDVTENGRTRLIFPSLSEDQRDPHPRLLCLENTISRLGGTLITPKHLEEVTDRARSQQMNVHLDGARLFNAAIALSVSVAELAKFADTVSVALTKAVGAPAGAVVAGSRDITAKIRRNRWMLGGNWKQGGVLAAACLRGLDCVHDVVPVDHQNARRLAEALHAMNGCRVDLDRVVTNIVFLEVTDPAIDVDQLRTHLTEHGFLFGRWKPGSFEGGQRCRLVTHRDIASEDVDRFTRVFAQSLGSQRVAECSGTADSQAIDKTSGG